MTITQLIEGRVISILRGVSRDAVVPTVEALYQGGVRAVEVTFNTPGAPQMVSLLRERFEGRVHVGAGTILDRDSAKLAISCGADFLLSPILDQGMVETTVAAGRIAVPGVMTPTEMLNGVRWGAQLVKVFPAVTVGPEFFRQAHAPLEFIQTMAVGGITLNNFREFLQAGAACVGVGGGLADPKLIAARDWEGLTARARAFLHDRTACEV